MHAYTQPTATTVVWTCTHTYLCMFVCLCMRTALTNVALREPRSWIIILQQKIQCQALGIARSACLFFRFWKKLHLGGRLDMSSSSSACLVLTLLLAILTCKASKAIDFVSVHWRSLAEFQKDEPKMKGILLNRIQAIKYGLTSFPSPLPTAKRPSNTSYMFAPSFTSRRYPITSPDIFLRRRKVSFHSVKTRSGLVSRDCVEIWH
jgi:hypothetical protein